MTRTISIFTLVATAALAGCNQQGHSAEQENEAANEVVNAPVVLPPSITASKTYRCKDNSLIYIDWLSDGSAKVKKSQDEYTAPVVKPGEEGSPLKGAADAASVTYQGQSCKG